MSPLKPLNATIPWRLTRRDFLKISVAFLGAKTLSACVSSESATQSIPTISPTHLPSVTPTRHVSPTTVKPIPSSSPTVEPSPAPATATLEPTATSELTATPEPKPTQKPTQPPAPTLEQPATPTAQPQLLVEPAPSGNCTDVERSEKRFTFGTLSNQFGNHGPGAPFPESPLFGKEQIFVKVTRKPDSSNTIEVFAGEFGTRIINLNGVNIWMENSPLGGLAKQFCHPNVIGENDTIFLYVPQGSDLTMGIWPVEIARGQR